jgi:xyloglucan-specific endo-beta-1,4-glucanase
MFKTGLTLVALAALASAQTLTTQYGCTPAGQFTLCQNLWGECTLKPLE